MNYKVNLIKDKAYCITKEYNGKEIEFNVVVANDESEIPGLIDFYINSLDNPLQFNLPNNNPQNINDIIEQQQTMINELIAKVAALESK